jgi:hypothetical protein
MIVPYIISKTPCLNQPLRLPKSCLRRFTEWQQVKGERFVELKSITQPTLVINGSSDVMIPTINSFTLSQHIPNAQLIIYPDSGHASLFQYPELFLSHARIFLDSRVHKKRKTMAFFCCNAHRSDLPLASVTCITSKKDCAINPKSKR